MFRRYEFIRERLDHPVIVAVKDGICTGCHIAVPPQTFIELQRGQQIMSCPNCQRLIFWDKHFEEEAPDQVNAEEASKEAAEANADEEIKTRQKKAVKAEESEQTAETEENAGEAFADKKKPSRKKIKTEESALASEEEAEEIADNEENLEPKKK